MDAKTVLSLLVLVALAAALMYLNGRVSDNRSADFKASATPAERQIVRSMDEIPWTAPQISSVLPVDADGDPLKPWVTAVDVEPRGVRVGWQFPPGFGADDWQRLWPRVEAYVAGNDPVRTVSVSRSGAMILVESRDPLSGSRRSSWG
jgi:hypothetical protein